jgi:hypothetical protein
MGVMSYHEASYNAQYKHALRLKFDGEMEKSLPQFWMAAWEARMHVLGEDKVKKAARNVYFIAKELGLEASRSGNRREAERFLLVSAHAVVRFDLGGALLRSSIGSLHRAGAAKDHSSKQGMEFLLRRINDAYPEGLLDS